MLGVLSSAASTHSRLLLASPFPVRPLSGGSGVRRIGEQKGGWGEVAGMRRSQGAVSSLIGSRFALAVEPRKVSRAQVCLRLAWAGAVAVAEATGFLLVRKPPTSARASLRAGPPCLLQSQPSYGGLVAMTRRAGLPWRTLLPKSAGRLMCRSGPRRIGRDSERTVSRRTGCPPCTSPRCRSTGP